MNKDAFSGFHIRAFIESEFILAVIHKYDLSRVPKDQSHT